MEAAVQGETWFIGAAGGTWFIGAAVAEVQGAT